MLQSVVKSVRVVCGDSADAKSDISDMKKKCDIDKAEVQPTGGKYAEPTNVTAINERKDHRSSAKRCLNKV